MKFFETSKYYSLKKSIYINLRWIGIIGQIISVYLVFFYLKFEFEFIYSNIIIFLGILSNIYVRLQIGITAIDAKQYLQKYYHNSDFVIITNGDTPPNLRDVVHTNLCKINIFPSGLSGGAVIISAIDNLKKGAAGQAVQNMNIRLNIPQTTGLGKLAIFP